MNQTDKRYEQGKTLLAEGRTREAIAVFESLTKDMPKFKKAWEKLAYAYIQSDQISDAIRCYDEILIRYPKDAFSYYQKSVLEEKLNLLDAAMESIEKALKYGPGNAEFVYSKGFVLYRKKRLNDAISWFEKALDIDPFFFAAADYKCMCLMALGIYDELIASCLEYVERFKDFVENASFEIESDEKGGELFGREAEIIKKEDLWRLYSYLSFSYMKLGAFLQAEEVLLKELEFDYEKHRVYYYLGLVQNAAGKYEQALSSYLTALELEPDFKPARINLGLVYAKIAEAEFLKVGKVTEKGNELYSKALFSFKVLLKSDPENSNILYEVGKIHFALGDLKEAKEAFCDILHLDPGFVPVYEYLAKIKFMEGDYEAALSYLSEAQAKDPFNYEIMNLTGVIYSKKGDNDFALQCLTRAEMLDPANPKAHYNKALIFMKEKRYAEASKALLKIKEADTYGNGISYAKVLEFQKTALEHIEEKEETA